MSLVPGGVPEHAAAGTLLEDKYDLMQHRLGRGHFAEVRLGLAHQDRQRVAVKVLAKGDTARTERIQSEIAILRRINRLQHPNLVHMLDAFDADTECFVVLELLDGGSLLDQLTGRGFLPEAQGRSTIRQVASGLKAIHDLGIVHRDVKPENILFGSDGVAKLVDFGFAKADSRTEGSMRTGSSPDIEHSFRFATSPCGTPGFVAPEVLQHTGYDCAVDNWSLGVLTFMVLYGQAPFTDQLSPTSPTPGSPPAYSTQLQRAPEAEQLDGSVQDAPWGLGASIHGLRLSGGASPSAAASPSESGPEPVGTARVAMMGTDVEVNFHVDQRSALHRPVGLSPLQTHGLHAESAGIAIPVGSGSCGGQGGGLARTSLGVPLGTDSDLSGRNASDSPTIARRQALLHRSQLGHFAFPEEPEVSAWARKFITSLLQVDPMARLSAADALKHQWLRMRSRIQSGEIFDGNASQGASPGEGGIRPPALPPRVAAGSQQTSPCGGSPIGCSVHRGDGDRPLSPHPGALSDADFGGTPEGVRLVTRPQQARGILPQSSDESSDGSDCAEARPVVARRGGVGSNSQRMVRPPALSDRPGRMAARRRTAEW
eukprot:CAMPEP_0115836982 /NCGR_PEP_ID=MMETSP0287-20121206/4985_1 /TAXON_ID=412157 /ORGANISM="Chrysochromulina rotalis, Strain UIO044" /LENGTH=598 /DNA_ID=CAMNT_0003290477 /DNA_START=23 /DNA_END=1820 /DNA_ORIENTATION=-